MRKYQELWYMEHIGKGKRTLPDGALSSSHQRQWTSYLQDMAEESACKGVGGWVVLGLCAPPSAHHVRGLLVFPIYVSLGRFVTSTFLPTMPAPQSLEAVRLCDYGPPLVLVLDHVLHV